MKKCVTILVCLLCLVCLIMAAGCRHTGEPVEGTSFTYCHDALHEVGIWHIKTGHGEAMFVLPDSEYENPGVYSWKELSGLD